MNKLIFLILSILLSNIKSAKNPFESDRAKISCTRLSYGYWDCTFYTRSSCCYVGRINCHMRPKPTKCQDSRASGDRKESLEYLIQEEYELYDKKKK